MGHQQGESKEALDEFLRQFLQMFFPEIESRIDWAYPPEALDGELAKLFPDSELGKALVDRLYKVRLLDGGELWVLIHVEVQTQRDDDFPERVFRYFYRLRDNSTCRSRVSSCWPTTARRGGRASTSTSSAALTINSLFQP